MKNLNTVRNKKAPLAGRAGGAVTTSLCAEAAYSDRRSGGMKNCFLARLMRDGMGVAYRMGDSTSVTASDRSINDQQKAPPGECCLAGLVRAVWFDHHLKHKRPSQAREGFLDLEHLLMAGRKFMLSGWSLQTRMPGSIRR